MLKKTTIIKVAILILALAVLVTGCGRSKREQANSNNAKIAVVTSVYPVYEFTRRVGGDKVAVTMLVPAGVEPHEWEPTAKDLTTIRASKLFLYHGAGFEPWLDKMITPQVLGGATAVAVSKNIPLLSGIAGEDGKNSEDTDPHIWVDPVLAQQEVNNITEALAAVDPANAGYYRQNADNFNAELAKLHNEYETTLKTAKQRTFITSHAAFGYLAKRYNLQQMAVMGLSPDAEPTPEKMAAIVNFCRENNVKYIFLEALVNPKISGTIAKEAGAQTLVLNPVDGMTEQDLQQGKNYLSVMRQNLASLKIALTE